MNEFDLITLALLSFSVGSGILLYSIASFYLPVISFSYLSSTVPEYAEDPYGFLFFTSEDVIHSATSSLLFVVDKLQYREGTAHVQMFADFFGSMANTSNDSTFFVLQTFGGISDVNININGDSPEGYGKKETIVTHDRSATSYLLIEIPKANITGHIQVFIEFTWKGIFWRHSFYMYNFIVSFNSAFPSYIHEVGLPREAINGNGLLLPDLTFETTLSVARPETATISDAMPNPDVIGFSYGKVWYSWDIKKRSDRDRYASTAVSIGVEVEELKTKYDSSWASFMLCLGIGIPLIISSFIELIRIYHSRKTAESNQQSHAGEKLQSDEETNKQTEDKELIELIRNVDKNFEKKPLKILLKTILLSLPNMFVVIFLGYLLYVISEVMSAGFSQFSTETQVTLLVAVAAALIAFCNLAVNIPQTISPQRSYDELVDYNYSKLKDKVCERDRLLLKALIMMKSKQPEFGLEDVLKQSGETLTRNRLLEKLYE